MQLDQSRKPNGVGITNQTNYTVYLLQNIYSNNDIHGDSQLISSTLGQKCCARNLKVSFVALARSPQQSGCLDINL
jgi:hypothetical protein